MQGTPMAFFIRAFLFGAFLILSGCSSESDNLKSWARLAKVTGDQKYLEFMDREYHATYDLLWSEKDHLFWRDSSYFGKSEKNGEDIFWARGNGWVFGGLALMIPDLPQNWDGRAFYIDLYKKMAKRIKSIQRADGTWSMGLLGGTEGYPITRPPSIPGRMASC